MHGDDGLPNYVPPYRISVFDPIVGEGFEVRLPKGTYILQGQSVDVCVEVEDYCKCEVTTYMSNDVPPKISFNLS